MTKDELIAEKLREAAKRADWYQTGEAKLLHAAADALEAATRERAAVPDAQAERVSMEVLNEYRKIAAWLESQAALRGATGDTMHGLAAEALATLIDHEYSRHTIPLYGMLDVWMALYGTSHPGFDEFYDEHGYAEAWSRLMAEIRSQVAAPDAATEVLDAHRCDESAERAYKRTIRAEAERDAALAAIERIREAVSGHPECDRYEEDDVISCGWKSAYASVVAALDGAPEPEWEYARQNRYGNVCEPDDSREQAEYRASLGGGYDTVVRRPLVWWEPLPAEGDNA